MAYIGNTQQNQSYVPAVDFFNGDGSTVAFTLSRPVASVAAVQAVISNVPQNPGSAFTVSGSTITFTSAPPSGTANIYVYYTSPNTQVVQPGQGTVGATQVDGNYALWNKSGSDINYTAGSAGIGIAPTGLAGTRLYINGTSTSSTEYYINGARNSYFYNSSGGVQIGTYANIPVSFLIANTEQARLDTSGNLLFNSGYGSVANAYGCRAWVNFNGTGTVAIRASGNVSSITDNGTADYTVNFTSAMPDANYCAQATTASSNLGGGACAAMMNTQAAMATSSVRILLSNFTTGPDQAYVGVSVFR